MRLGMVRCPDSAARSGHFSLANSTGDEAGVNDLLDITMIESGKLELEYQMRSLGDGNHQTFSYPQTYSRSKLDLVGKGPLSFLYSTIVAALNWRLGERELRHCEQLVD
jgi:hypothetical protein